MLTTLNKILIILLIITISFSCKNEKPKPSLTYIKQKYKEPLVKINKHLVKEDIDRINGYCRRRNWKMKLNKAGLFYDIYKKTNGDSVKTGDVVIIKYKLSLLNGKLCYTSDSLGAKSFKVGQGGVEKGLEIGILLMRKGEKARFIMAPFLAYGLIGDEKKIPPLSTIVYDIELIDILKQNTKTNE